MIARPRRIARAARKPLPCDADYGGDQNHAGDSGK
jgi:hypothetical protein